MIKENWGYLEYTYLHRLALKYLIIKIIKDPEDKRELLRRAEIHDLDKALMYTMMPKKMASEIHREYSRHHMENELEKNRFDLIEAVLDYECAALTKPDKPLNAYDTILKYRKNHVDELMEVMKELGIASSYERKSDEEFEGFIRSHLPVTEEAVLGEIYSYIANNPKEAAFYIVEATTRKEEKQRKAP